ncbi:MULTISPECIES: SH3 domain-containing protein [unclassified Devosia]|uniref:SH3 domain-containing protein n=1 Tax=unclassified Devosia TaxID=196773 RepID=UPI000FDA9BD1|nr:MULTISPECIES: SH3 domain-containing protein [unclassified Devosia]
MKSVRLGLITTFAAVLAGTIAAAAAPASVSTNVNVRSGPSTQHPVVGSLFANNTVDVGQCSAGWCQISAGHVAGWVSSDFVVIGRQAQAQVAPRGNGFGEPGFDLEFNFGGPGRPFPPPPPAPPAPPVYDDEEAGACFYTRPDFRGEQFCVTEGETYDYLPGLWDDSFRSVEIYGGARVDVCRDEELSGACATLRRDTARLPRELDRRISSLDVY